jgi:hypothetical protein
MESTRKVVQTELETESYNILKHVVKKKGMSIKDGVRQAVKDWTLRESDMKDDPFFDTSNVIKGKKVTDAATIDDSLYRGKKKR